MVHPAPLKDAIALCGPLTLLSLMADSDDNLETSRQPGEHAVSYSATRVARSSVTILSSSQFLISKCYSEGRHVGSKAKKYLRRMKCFGTVPHGVICIVLLLTCSVEPAAPTSSDATLKSLTFQRRRRRDTAAEMSPTCYTYSCMTTNYKADYEALADGWSGSPPTAPGACRTLHVF